MFVLILVLLSNPTVGYGYGPSGTPTVYESRAACEAQLKVSAKAVAKEFSEPFKLNCVKLK